MRKDNEKINVLMNIKNFFGSNQGRILPWVIFLLVALFPFILYALVLGRFLNFWIFLVFEVLFAGRVWLKTVGGEDKKFAAYMNARENVYKSADELINVSSMQEDGIVEYANGIVMYIISGFTNTCMENKKLAAMLTEFVQQLDPYVFDVYFHMVTKEFLLQERIGNTVVYSDKELMKERVEFYVHQDEEMNAKSQLYRYNFVVYGTKYEWKALKKVVNNAVHSSAAKVFKEVYVCNREQANDVMSRDLLVYVRLEEMLQRKYQNTEYYNSKVYYYGETPPENLRVKKDTVNLEERREVVD